MTIVAQRTNVAYKRLAIIYLHRWAVLSKLKTVWYRTNSSLMHWFCIINAWLRLINALCIALSACREREINDFLSSSGDSTYWSEDWWLQNVAKYLFIFFSHKTRSWISKIDSKRLKILKRHFLTWNELRRLFITRACNKHTNVNYWIPQFTIYFNFISEYQSV